MRVRERERGGKAERPDDGLITLHGRDTSSIEENFYEFQIHFPNVRRRRLPPVSRPRGFEGTPRRNSDRKEGGKKKKKEKRTNTRSGTIYTEIYNRLSNCNFVSRKNFNDLDPRKKKKGTRNSKGSITILYTQNFNEE